MPTGQTSMFTGKKLPSGLMGGVVCKPYKSCKQVHKERISPCILRINGEDATREVEVAG